MLSREDRKDGIANSIVEASSLNSRFRTRTDRSGRFVFENIPPGSYSIQIIRARIPDNYALETDRIKVIAVSGVVSSAEFNAYRTQKSARVIHRESLRLRTDTGSDAINK